MKINGNPDGGGGREPIVESLSVTSNGIYTPSAGVDGFNEVNVDVPSRIPVYESLSITENGTYIPGSGVDGFDNVEVNVSTIDPGFTMNNILQTGYTKSILSDSTITYVRRNAAYENSIIKTVNLPNCTLVDYAAFQSCNALSQVSLPVCSYINGMAFKYCYNLESVYLLSNSVVTIQTTDVFEKNSFLTIYVPAELYDTYINASFWRTLASHIQPDLPYLSFSDGVVLGSTSSLSSNYYTELGINVGDITSLSLPLLSSAGPSTFKGHYNLTSFHLPILSEYADCLFYGCSGFSEIKLDNDVKSLGNSVFANCTGLTKLTIAGAGITTGTGTLDGCTNLSLIEITDDYYLTAPGWSEYSSLMVVTMPELSYSNGLVYGSISELTASYLTRLGIDSNSVVSVSLPYCKSIGEKTFLEHHSLKDVYLPMCEYIATSGFFGVNNMNGFELPVCSYIGDNAFYWCNNYFSYLTLGYSGVCELAGYNTFYMTPVLNSIYVPASLVDAYKADSAWMSMSSKIYPI